MNVGKSKEANFSPWQIIAINDYDSPMDFQANVLEKPWVSLKKIIKREAKSDITVAETELRELPHVQLANLVPDIDWALPADALQSLANENNDIPKFLVCQPFCEHAKILTHWAKANQIQLIQPPDISQVLTADKEWLSSLPTEQKKPWVLPDLERCFLRHTQGLELLRRFLELAHSGLMGPGIIGCDSWAFAFIKKIWPLPDSSPLTLQAFDGHALEAYFTLIKQMNVKNNATQLLSTKTGRPLLPYPEDISTGKSTEFSEKKPALILPELRQLAAHCRGNPGLAWHYWRKKLRSSTDGYQQTDASSKTGKEIVWVLPNIEEPSLPTDATEDVAFLIHALLIHRGLSTDLLCHMLPISRSRIISQLARMKTQCLVICKENTWSIAPLAYPLIRDFLNERHYLVDPF